MNALTSPRLSIADASETALIEVSRLQRIGLAFRDLTDAAENYLDAQARHHVETSGKRPAKQGRFCR